MIDYIKYLPPDSALAREMLGGAADWGTTEHLLANTVDLLSAANWQRAGGKGTKPKPLKRPKPPRDLLGG